MRIKCMYIRCVYILCVCAFVHAFAGAQMHGACEKVRWQLGVLVLDVYVVFNKVSFMLFMAARNWNLERTSAG